MYGYDTKPNTTFSAQANESINKIRDSEYSVLVGRNNCGKSFLLKHLTNQWGQRASYVGPARYQNFNLLGYFTPNVNRVHEKWNNFNNQYHQGQQNIDNYPINLQQSIAELTDGQRDNLVEIISNLLGAKLEFRHTVEGNSMSQKYVDVNGHNISYTSSGFRLITTLVTSLLDTDFDTFLIDEPELGISPEAQGILADFLFDRKHREKYFSHIRTIVFATHSTIFLDRANIANNYTISKIGDEIEISPVENQIEFNKIHFFLLGNRFETLYLPSVIVLVEGKCDHIFIEKLLCIRFPSTQISVIPANSDSRIKEVLAIAKGLFTDLQKSPYRDRIIVILDAVHSASLPQTLTAMGLLTDNIIKWEKNGIEYYYPPSLVDIIFGNGPEIIIAGDVVSRNGRSYSKNDLAEKIVTLMDSSTPQHEDIENLLLKLIADKV